jgi:hypothetical protein
MASTILAPSVLPSVPDGSCGVPILKSLGGRPELDEGGDVGLPPAAEQRAQTAFETAGIILILLIALAGAWILIRRRM